MRRKESIIYVNFAPYDNTGRILDFLLESFNLVILLSFDFHKLNNKHSSNYLKIFLNGKEIDKKKFFKLPTPEALLFISLPFIALIIAIQSVWNIVKLSFKYGKFDIYLSVNAFTAWIGNILRDLNVVDKTIFWVWDYYPPGYPDWRIRLARWAYWRFDKMNTISSNRTIFLNNKLVELRQQIGVLAKSRKYLVVPIGTNPTKTRVNRKNIIGHFGVLKRFQGLDLLFDNLDSLSDKIPNLKVEIIGSGPDEKYFRQRAKKFPMVKFYGYIKEDNLIDNIIRHWNVGLAAYIPDTSSPAYWTDPAKIKAYISQGLPVITTSITPFSVEIKKSGAGVIVDYFDPQEFVDGVFTILQSQKKFRNKAYELSKKYYYKDMYPRLFYFR